MNTSKTYIKMCGCEEIQRHGKKPLDWSGIQDHYYKGAYSYGLLTDGSYTYWNGSHFIWLPRQDQLQEMVDLSLKAKIYRFSLWSLFYATTFTSMEQLWLAFVMKEKHNKVWDGSEWIST